MPGGLDLGQESERGTGLFRVRDDAGVEGLRSSLRRQAGPITFGSPENRRSEPVRDNFRVPRDSDIINRCDRPRSPSLDSR